MLKDDLIAGAAAAASECGLTVRQVYKLVDQGRLPAVRKGTRLYFRKSELDAAFRSDAA